MFDSSAEKERDEKRDTLEGRKDEENNVTEDDSSKESANNELGKVIGTFCQKSEPPGIKTPGDIDVLPDSKSPVSKGVGTPGCSQTKVYKVNLVERNFRCICLFFNAAAVITSNTICQEESSCQTGPSGLL